MSNYNIQMHNYNGVGYDNLYPKTKSNMVLDGDTNLETKLKYYSNDNLFDNWYFIGGGSQQGGEQFPVNQRGQTSYTGAGFGIDRWLNENSNAVMQVNSDSITFRESSGSNYTVLLQKCDRATVDNLLGKTATFSVLATEGLFTTTFTFPTDTSTNFQSPSLYIKPRVDACVMLYFTTSNYQLCRIVTSNGASVNLIAVKLELGDTQTLAHQENGVWVLNEIPNFQLELMKCQRYQLVLDYTRALAVSPGIGDPVCYIEEHFPMEKTPTPTLLKAGSVIDSSGGEQWNAITNVSCTAFDYRGSVLLRFGLTNTAVRGACYLFNTTVMLDANL